MAQYHRDGALMIESIINRIPLLSSFSIDEIEVQSLSGQTNNNYLLSVAGNKYVLRIPRQSTDAFINRKNESHNVEIVQQLGLSPENVWRGEGNLTGVSLTEYINHSNNPKSGDEEILKKIATILVTLHRNKKPFKGMLSNQKIMQSLQQYFEACTLEQQQALKTDYQKTLSLLESHTSNRPAVSSHIDLVAENILLENNKIWLIDWEYSAMASPFWDIATVCNSYDLDSNKSERFLKIVLENCQKEDVQSLQDYQIIVKTIGACWQAAFNQLT